MWDVTWCYCVMVALVAQCAGCWGAHPPITADGSVEPTWLEVTTQAPCKSPGKTIRAESVKNRNFVVDTYIVEHEISEPGAKTVAKEINPSDFQSYAIACEECTDSEIDYCSGTAIIQDHCCCDGRFIESFPYVPHTCYRGPEVCKPVKSDCEEYMRIRDCCCRVHLASKWKVRFFGNSASTNRHKSKLIRWLWILSWIIYLSLT